jgi:hypothetical protein
VYQGIPFWILDFGFWIVKVLLNKLLTPAFNLSICQNHGSNWDEREKRSSSQITAKCVPLGVLL